MVLCKALGDARHDVASGLRRYENTRRHKVQAVSWLTTQQVSRPEPVLKPAAIIPDRLMTGALTTFLRWTSHRQLSADIGRALAASTPIPSVR
jgi:FAD-dependent urate hydroxylase